MLIHYVYIALGGAFGALLRVLLANTLPAALWGVPLPILSINVLGCFVMGILTEMMAFYQFPPASWRYFLISGCLGGFTTFSSFALELGLLIQKHCLQAAFMYAFASFGLSMLAFFAGLSAIRILH